MSEAGNGVFYQRLPYVSEPRSSGRKCVTRLIGLAAVTNAPSKDKTRKYLHALQVTPSAAVGSATAAVDIPAGTTQNPYMEMAIRAPVEPLRHDEPPSKRHKPEAPRGQTGGLSAEQIADLTAKSASSAQFFYDQKLAARGQRQGALRQDHSDHPNQRDNRRRAPPVPERAECWFCLATPSVERHLIVSIGQEAYLAMPKGAINSDHVLIVPIAHASSTTALSAAAWTEIERFKRGLRDLFAANGKEMIVLDRNVQTIGAAHCHVQVVGVPRANAVTAKRVFETEGERYHVRFEEIASDAQLQDATDGKPFFYAEVPAPPVSAPADDDGSDESGDVRVVRLLNIVDGKHYMQFGRHAATCVLDMPQRANWKNCVVPKAEEEQMTLAFKKQWQPFDFTLEGEDADDE